MIMIMIMIMIIMIIIIISTSSPSSYSDPIWKMGPGFSETNKRPILLSINPYEHLFLLLLPS